MISDIERIYGRLLDRDYPKDLFGSLPSFAPKGDGYISLCPFHEDAHPTFLIYRDRPMFFCFACSARGDWISYLQRKEGMGFYRILDHLKKVSGISTLDYDKTTWNDDLNRTTLFEMCHGFFKTKLWSDEGEHVLNYLYGRGYAMGEVEGMALGFYPGYDRLRQYLVSQGIGEDVIDQYLSPVWKKDVKDQELVIPFRDTSGRLMGFVGRDISLTGPDAYRPLVSMDGLEDTPFLLDRARNREEVVLVEGMFDAMLIDRLETVPAIAIGTSGLNENHILAAMACGVKRFIIALGNGPAQERASADAYTLVRSKGLDAATLTIPGDSKDLDEYIRSTSLHDFRKLLKTAEKV